MAHFVRTCLIVAAVVAITFLPFVAGGHDPLAVPLAEMAWALGRFSLLLVPLGALWLWASVRSSQGSPQPIWLQRITSGTCTLLALLIVVMALAASGPMMAVGVAALAGVLVIRLRRRLQSGEAGRSTSRIAASCLVAAPLAIFAIQTAFVDRLASDARNRVIANCAPLIAEIEQYRSRHGTYPVSLFSIYGDCKPAIWGVERYHYERSGDAYNVVFREPSLGFGTKRFVVYNPLDKQRVTVHETDRLRLDEAGLDADNAGYTIAEPLPQPHWKAFLFLS